MAQRLHVATRKGLFILERGGGHAWTIESVSFLGDPVSMVLPDCRDGTLYAALDHGHFGVKLHRSPDGGETWEELACPEYPPKPEGLNDTNPMQQKPIPWKLVLIWSLESGGRDEPGGLWCGTIPGGLFRSPDRGQSWELTRPLWDDPKRREWFGGGADLPGIHSICVDPRDSKHVTIGVSCGGVWETADGGESWGCKGTGMWAAYMPPDRKGDPNIQDVHRLIQCPAVPDTMWAQHHNAIFRSNDGGTNWIEIADVEPSVFGFAAAVHPRDADTAWFVPAEKDERRIPVDGKVVVARTRDGGESFETLRKGLPQEHAYDLTYRHGLDVDGEGECVAFGTTTGSLWISENQGDSWVCASRNLPPVYCVRFG